MFLGLDCWGSLKQSIRVSFGFLEDGPSLRLGDVSLDVYCLGFRVQGLGFGDICRVSRLHMRLP